MTLALLHLATTCTVLREARGRALDLLNVIALHELRLHDRAARRRLARLLEERHQLSVSDIQLAAAALAALPTASHDGALLLLRSLAGSG